ncbi:MAG: response regulator [Nitrospinae bacterium]|nr:response regulator [Nitrospinota bacterium]
MNTNSRDLKLDETLSSLSKNGGGPCAAKSTPKWNALRLLLVEDSKDDEFLLVAALRREGGRIHFERVETAGEMAAALDNREWDIVVSDYSLPRFSALQAISLLQRKGLDIPIIVVSGAAPEKLVAETMKAGARDYVMKDNLTRLLPAIKREARDHAIRRELASSVGKLADFAYNASAELREPLRKIMAFGDRLSALCYGRFEPGGKDYVERMVKAAGRMDRLIDDLQKYFHATAKTGPFQPADLMEAVNEALADLETAVSQKKARVVVAGPLPTIDADAPQMRQLFQNLISNALKFSREDEPPHVRIQCANAKDGQVEITVADNGIGFDEKYLDRIFQPFERLHGKNKYPGSGIGLALCRQIAARHGGSITATSWPGTGSEFTVTLPAKQNRAEERPRERAGPDAASG